MSLIKRVVNNVFWVFPLSKMLAEFITIKMRFLSLSETDYWNECERFYDSLDFNNAVVIDIGDDVGTSPLFFISRGAKQVYGFSTMPQLYFNSKYKHSRYRITEKNIGSFIDSVKEILSHNEHERTILKMDVEGAEWLFNVDFINMFDDYVVALHSPIKNEPLYEWIKSNSVFIGNVNAIEFAVYKRMRK